MRSRRARIGNAKLNEKKRLCLTSVDILLSKDCHHGLELRAWSLEKEFTTQSSKLKALSDEETKPLEQDISTVVTPPK